MKTLSERNAVKTDCLGREVISVKRLLEWAFATECAQLDYDEVGAALGIGMPGVGAEYRIEQQLALGFERGEGVRPDTSFGRSLPHDDAELVATVLRNAVPFTLATSMAQYARACRVPKWDLGPQSFEPVSWGKRNHIGRYGKTEVCETIRYVSRGRMRSRQVLCTPVRVVPSADQIASARRRYLEWWGGLLSVLGDLRWVELSRFVVSERMPPMEPWKSLG